MTNEDAPEQLPVYVAHFIKFFEEAKDWPETDRFTRAMGLLHFGAYAQDRFPFDETFPNALAASVALARGYQQLQAGWYLTSYGFLAEARNLLRSVYESVGLARVLAKEPKMAEQWLKEGKWFPDKRVRQWLADVRQDPPEQLENWKNFYSEASAWAHPTAESCMAQLKVETDAFVLSPLVKFSSGECRGTVSLLSSTAVFACFAFRNAVVDERAIDPNWRRDLYDLAREVSDDPMSHLDRDWQAEKEHFDAVMTKLRDRRHLKRELKMNPRAWDNLKPGG